MGRKLKPTVWGWVPPPPEEMQTHLMKKFPTGDFPVDYVEPLPPKTGRSPLCDLELFIPPYEEGDYRFHFEPNGVLVYEFKDGDQEPLKPLTGFAVNVGAPERLIPLWPPCIHLKPQSVERTPCHSYKLVMGCILTQAETTVTQCQLCPHKQLFEGN